jgi:hypothetical protein
VTAEALDAWLPESSVRTRHRRTAAVGADALWAAARGLRLKDTQRLGRMVRWRIPGLEATLTYHELFRAYPFCVLEESEHGMVSGLCGRIWTPNRDYPALDGPDAFAAWNEPGTVRVAIANSVRALGSGRSEIVSEARVQPVDMHARVRLKAIWAVLGPFERLVGSEPMTLAVRRAEQAG